MRSLFLGDNKTQYGCFYTGMTQHFQMVWAEEVHAHDLETTKAIKTIQDMNTKHGIAPDAGVKKFQKEQSQALKDHVEDLMA